MGVGGGDASSFPDQVTTGGAAGATGADAAGGARDAAGEAAAIVDTCLPPSSIDQPIVKLSQTGCVDPNDPKKFFAGAVPYELNSPLWSDSADKTRAFVLPPGKKIHVKDCVATPAECPGGVADNGKWVFPIGAVMIKNFLFDGKFVETRLFMHVDGTSKPGTCVTGTDCWVGYGYQWDEAQTDASVVPDQRVDIMFNTGKRTVHWHYPSRMDCMTCHNDAGGPTLGPEMAQMNRLLADGTNQIDNFKTLGVFETAPTKPYKTALVTPYPGQLGGPPATATIEQEARSYLHANCGFCHRPDGVWNNFDLRNDIALKDAKICNVAVKKSATGVDPLTTKLLAPNNIAQSAISIRMAQVDPDLGRMPQIASYMVDDAAVTLVNKWIQSITTCP
jgi:hypothetical protein